MATPQSQVILEWVPIPDAAARVHQAYFLVLAARNFAPQSKSVSAPNPSKEVIACPATNPHR